METNLKQELSAITVNSVPARQESKLPLVGDEERLKNSVAAIPVAKADPEELAQALRYVMVKVGLRAANWPNAEEEELLFAHVLTEYGSHTAAEIRLAFDMAIAGKLDIAHKDVVCYENFSCLYFSGVMNSYQRWAAQAYRHAMVGLPPPISNLPRWEVLLEYAWYLQKELKKRLRAPLK